MVRRLLVVFIIFTISITFQPAFEIDGIESAEGNEFVVLTPPLENDLKEIVDDIKKQNPIAFIENRGQLENAEVRYYTPGGNFWVTENTVWYQLIEFSEHSNDDFDHFDFTNHVDHLESITYDSAVVKQTFIGANKIQPEGRSKAVTYYNYFFGNDSSKWRPEVPSYQEVFFENLYGYNQRK